MILDYLVDQWVDLKRNPTGRAILLLPIAPVLFLVFRLLILLMQKITPALSVESWIGFGLGLISAGLQWCIRVACPVLLLIFSLVGLICALVGAVQKGWKPLCLAAVHLAGLIIALVLLL